MSLSSISAGSFNYSNALCRTGAGVLYAIFVNDSGNICAYKNVDGDPSSELDSETPTTVFGGGAFTSVAGAIDGSDVIHVIASGNGKQTRDVAYGTFDPATDTFGGTWTEVAAYGNGAPTNSKQNCDICITANGNIHILAVVNNKEMGTNTDEVVHNYHNGTAWQGETEVSDVNDQSWACSITAAGSDGNEVEGIYIHDPAAGSLLEYRRWTSGGGWGGASSYDCENANLARVVSVCADEGDGTTIHRAYMDNSTGNNDLSYNGADTTYNGNFECSMALAQQHETLLLFYTEFSNEDLKVLVDTGSGWSSPTTLETGTFRWIVTNTPLHFRNDRVDVSWMAYDQATGSILFDRYRAGRRDLLGHV